jgi:esterase/lipase superfamily enzyme
VQRQLVSVYLQETSWFQDFRKAEDKVRRAAAEAYALQEAIEERNAESNIKAIVESIESMVPALSAKVIQAA